MPLIMQHPSFLSVHSDTILVNAAFLKDPLHMYSNIKKQNPKYL